MKLADFSVHRPVFTTMVTLIVILLGMSAFNRLQVDLLPEIELPTLSIRTGYEGASPEVMERQVTQIIEEIIGTVPGVEEITSSSSEGRSNVRVRFTWGTDIDKAALDLQATLEDEINELPDDIVRPRVNKWDINSFPVVLIGVSGNLDPVDLTRLVNEEIRYRFARVPGVAQVDLWGGYDRELRVELDKDRISALGLPLNQVVAALRDANLDRPTGMIEEGRMEVTLRAPGQFETIEQIENTVVALREGAAITIGDIATVRDTYERITRIIRVNGERGIRVAIRKEADANTVEVSRRILEVIDEVNADFPQAEVVAVLNQGNFIENSIANVARSVLYGGGLAILILFLFLGNFRSTLVIALAIPISVVATFALVYFSGFTLNLMTLGGLALGVGMMVDSSIVVLENIFRLRDEEGLAPGRASIQGAQEVGPAIIASTITTLVIFLPLIFVEGVSGILFKELAYVIVFALASSLLVSLSLVPMLASKFLSGEKREVGGATVEWMEGVNRFLRGLTNRYQRLLARLLTHRLKFIVGMFLLLGGSFGFFPYIGNEFLPSSDEGEVRVTGEMEEGTRLGIVERQTRILEALTFPEVPEMVSSVVSVSGNRGSIQMSLVPAAQRSRSNVEVANALRRKLEGQVAGMEIRVRAPEGQFLLDRLLGGEEGLTVEIRGFELSLLEALARQAGDIIESVPGVTDFNDNLDIGLPQQEVNIDRNKLADLGLTVRDVTEGIQTAIAGTDAGEFRKDGESFRMLVRLKDAERLEIDDVLNLTLSTPEGDRVVLRNVVETRMTRAPDSISRKGQQRIERLGFNVANRPKGTVAAEVQEGLDQIPRPEGYTLSVAGSFEEQQKANNDLALSLILALVLVYMVLACQYETLRDPLIVMFSAPMAAIGVLLTLFFTGTTFNLQSSMGCIMLGGIVVNNAILLVDLAGKLHRQGIPKFEAVQEAGRQRLRPILMTTLTTALGLIPLALGVGEGADAQAPLARVVIGGLLGATLITLFLIPIIFTFFHRDPDPAA